MKTTLLFLIFTLIASASHTANAAPPAWSKGSMPSMGRSLYYGNGGLDYGKDRTLGSTPPLQWGYGYPYEYQPTYRYRYSYQPVIKYQPIQQQSNGWTTIQKRSPSLSYRQVWIREHDCIGFSYWRMIYVRE